MVKNIGKSSGFDRAHVEIVRTRWHTCHKTKIAPMDSDGNQPRIYGANLTCVPTWATRASNMLDLPASIRSSTSAYIDLSSKQDKKTSDYGQSPADSVSNRSEICTLTRENTVSIVSKNDGEHKNYVNQSPKKNLTCKSALKMLSLCLLGSLVIPALILPNVLLYLMLPSIFQTPVNQTTLIEPMVYANHCAGVSLYTRWLYYNSSGIYMPIDTTNCTFNITPLYFTSISGSDLQDDLTGSGAIYGASKYGFTIYCRSHSAWSGTQMLNYSQIEKWNVTWIGIYH